MARLPTVKLRTPNGGTLIVNLTEYQREISNYVRDGYRIISIREADIDTSDAVIDFARRQDEKDIARESGKNNDERARRRFEDRSHVNYDVITVGDPVEIIPVESSPVESAVVQQEVVPEVPAVIATVISREMASGAPRRGRPPGSKNVAKTLVSEFSVSALPSVPHDDNLEAIVSSFAGINL